MNIFKHLQRQKDWSLKTFGPGLRTLGIIGHIKKELIEVEETPLDVEEWIDIAILALDGAWRTGASPQEIVKIWEGKQKKNIARTWPDWRTLDENTPIEHKRD